MRRASLSVAGRTGMTKIVRLVKAAYHITRILWDIHRRPDDGSRRASSVPSRKQRKGLLVTAPRAQAGSSPSLLEATNTPSRAPTCKEHCGARAKGDQP